MAATDMKRSSNFVNNLSFDLACPGSSRLPMSQVIYIYLFVGDIQSVVYIKLYECIYITVFVVYSSVHMVYTINFDTICKEIIDGMFRRVLIS